MTILPKTAPYDSNRVREGWCLFVIPSRRANRVGFALDQLIGHQCHHRIQSEQHGRCSSNRQIAPLPLAFYSDVGSGLLEGHFHSPAPNEPAQDLYRRVLQIGRNKRLRLKFPQRVSDQNPSDRDRKISRTVSNGRLRIDFDLSFITSIPVFNFECHPLRFWPLSVAHLFIWNDEYFG